MPLKRIPTINNLTFHNLCTETQPPLGIRKLLGLGLKFCNTPSTYSLKINQSILKLAYSIRTRHYLLNEKSTTDITYHPQLYVKIRGWHPPLAPEPVEDKITLFEKKVKKAIAIQQQKKIHKPLNLTHQ